jgi:hypothetical protein
MESSLESIKEIKLKDFDFKQDSTFLLCSKRGTGKTVLVIDLLKVLISKHKYNSIFLFSKTANFSIKNDWTFIDKKYIFDDIDEDIIQEIVDHQKKRIKEKDNENTHIILVFDDLALHKRSKMLEELHTMGRHCHITVIVSIQYPKNLINPTIRANIDYLFFSIVSNDSLVPIHSLIYSHMSIKEFYEFTFKHNKNYQFLFYNNRFKDESDKWFLTRADEHKDLKLKRQKKTIKMK